MAYRFWKGIGAASNLSQTNPWGIWVAFDIVCGVALAAGGYTVAAAVYLFGQKQYRPVLRPAILTGFLGYAFVVVGLMVDLGQPWRLPYQFFLTPGTTAVMYEVGWCVFLYLMVLALEFLPAALEWLGMTKVRRLHERDLDRDHRPRRHALDAPPVLARRLLPDDARQAPPALVLAVPPDLLLRLVDRGRASAW